METELVQCAVAGCGFSPFPMVKSFVRRAERSGEGFYCPAGHSLSYGEGSDAKERRRLRERVEDLETRLAQRIQEAQLAYRACPWVGCGFVASAGESWNRAPLHTHMRAIHGMPTLAEVQAAQTKAS